MAAAARLARHGAAVLRADDAGGLDVDVRRNVVRAADGGLDDGVPGRIGSACMLRDYPGQ